MEEQNVNINLQLPASAVHMPVYAYAAAIVLQGQLADLEERLLHPENSDEQRRQAVLERTQELMDLTTKIAGSLGKLLEKQQP